MACEPEVGVLKCFVLGVVPGWLEGMISNRRRQLGLALRGENRGDGVAYFEFFEDGAETV